VQYYNDAPVAVVPLPYAEEAGGYEGGARVARSLAWVGLVYGMARLGMCGAYMMARWGRGEDMMSFYPWDTEGWEGLLLASCSGLVYGGLVAASVMTLRLTPLSRGAMLAYAAAAILLWVAEVGV
jgi:hypothetical protein